MHSLYTYTQMCSRNYNVIDYQVTKSFLGCSVIATQYIAEFSGKMQLSSVQVWRKFFESWRTMRRMSYFAKVLLLASCLLDRTVANNLCVKLLVIYCISHINNKGKHLCKFSFEMSMSSGWQTINLKVSTKKSIAETELLIQGRGRDIVAASSRR